MKRIAVIGGGSAGLCAARHFCRDPSSKFTVRVFEKSETVGGLWAYDRRAEFQSLETVEQLKYRTTMYRNLRTNLPKQIMSYPDFPQPKESPTFQSHFDVQDYLKSYADEFGVMDSVQLGTEVINVDPLEGKNAKPGFIKWIVGTRNTKTKKEDSDVYDAVLLCNGHFSVPKMPNIKNFKGFKGHILHSRMYKTPQPFDGLSVVILGAGASGRDIAVDLTSTAKSVVLSHKNIPLPTTMPRLVEEKPAIQEISDSGEVVFADGTSKMADAFILCTGYNYDFPFLTENCRVEIQNMTISPLFRHLFHILFPTMAFIGLGHHICPFTLFDYQSQCIKKVLSREKQLPSIEEMLSETARDIRDTEISLGRKDHYHNFGPRQWEYFDSLTDLAGIPKYPQYLKRLYEHVVYQRDHNLLNYRKENFKIVGNEDFVQV